MPLTTEQLLAPRFIKIARYPNDSRPIGHIVEPAGDPALAQIKHEDYPAIYSRLEWWEHREKDDMPEFIRFTRQYGRSIKRGDVYRWSNWGSQGVIQFKKDDCNASVPGGPWVTPATPEEYAAFEAANE